MALKRAQRKRSFHPMAPKEETPALPQRKSAGNKRGCPAPAEYPTAQLTLLPGLPTQLRLQKHLICRNSSPSPLLPISTETTRPGILRNQSGITSLCFPSPTFTRVARPLRGHNRVFMKPLDGHYCKTTLRMHMHDYAGTIA